MTQSGHGQPRIDAAQTDLRTLFRWLLIPDVINQYWRTPEPWGRAMRRREFITAIAGSAAAWPLAARAQQPEPMRRIGVLMGFPESDAQAQRFIAAFRDGLQRLGWTGDRNVRIDTRW